MRNSVTTFLSVLGVLLLLVAPAVGEDINPPPWRGSPGTTVQGWEFSTAELDPLPDWGENLYGWERAHVIPTAGHEWLQEFEGRLGVWPLSGSIEVPIPNVPDENRQKLIWIQLTWEPKPGTVQPYPAVSETEWGGQSVLIDEVPLAGNWLHSTYEIILPFNPPHETVFIEGGIYMDELVIDTWCVPEPTTVIMLSSVALLGVVALIRRRKK